MDLRFFSSKKKSTRNDIRKSDHLYRISPDSIPQCNTKWNITDRHCFVCNDYRTQITTICKEFKTENMQNKFLSPLTIIYICQSVFPINISINEQQTICNSYANDDHNFKCWSYTHKFTHLLCLVALLYNTNPIV